MAAASIGWAEVEVARIHVAGTSESPPAERAVSVGTDRITVPCELGVTFEGRGSVILTAASWRDDGTLATDSDNVAVVVGDAAAERLAIGRRRPGRVT